jgi:GTP-binding protein EngB required for normal cell division
MTENQTPVLPFVGDAHDNDTSVAHQRTPPGPVNLVQDPESLRFYTKTKLALAAQLRALREVINRRGDKTRLQQCDDLMVKLAEDRFTLAVLGQFKRGKSSLMNAIIGRALLPVGVLPLTSAITVLRFGPKERLLITRSDVRLCFPQEEPVERLAEFVTEKENPGNRKHVKTACVELPVPFLRRGLEFVDTPGVGSAIEANTTTTLNFLPECDAVLFVTSVDSPFTRVELEFLESIHQHVRKIFFVINKTDLLDSSERNDVLNFVRDTICKHMGTDDVKMYPVSSRLGLKSKLEGDWTTGLESGLHDLENALARFLSGEKASVFLTAIIERALWLYEQETVEIALRERAKELPENILFERLETLTDAWEKRKTARREIVVRIRRRILSEVPTALIPELRTVVRSETDALPGCVEQLLNSTSWLPIGCVRRQTERAAVGQLRQNISSWLESHREHLSFASDDAIQRDWERLQSNLCDIPALAADVFGSRRAAKPNKDDGHEVQPWHLEVKFGSPFLPDFSCHFDLPRMWTVLPVFLVRRTFKRRMQRDGDRLANEIQRAVIGFTSDAVGKALDDCEKEIELRAAEIEFRVLAAIGKTSASLPPQNINHIRDLEAEAEELSGIRERLLALRAEIVPADAAVEMVSEEFLASAPPVSPPSPAGVSRKMPDVEPAIPNLARDLKTRACPVCNHLSKAAFEFFSHFQYDLARSESAQEEFAELLGFCPLHTWQLEAISSPVGASIGFAKLAGRVSRILAARAKSPNGHAAKLIRDSTECHVCRLLRETEQDYLRRLAEFVETTVGHTAYARCQGVCLRHLGLWFPFLKGDIARFVLEEASCRFEQMSEDMQSFSMKTEALRRQLHNDDESDAYLRAITHLVGASANCQPMNKEAAEI